MGLKKLLKAIAGLAMLGVVLWDVPIIAKGVKYLFGAATTFDFIYERYRDPSWFGGALKMALNPPPGTALLVALIGLALIYWSTKPRIIRMSGPVLGMLISVISLAAFAVWYLVVNQTSGPLVAQISNSSSASAEVMEKLGKLEAEHTITLSQLAAANQKLEAKEKESSEPVKKQSSTGPKDRSAIKSQLQTFYASGSEIVHRPIRKDISEPEWVAYVTQASKWINETANWIQGNLGPSGLAKFRASNMSSMIGSGNGINDKHDALLTNMNRYLENLGVLMESGAYDKG